MVLEAFDVVSAAAAEHDILVCLGGAAKSATRRGRRMSIDRLITFGQSQANVE